MITKRTSLKKIIALAERDFGVKVTRSEAKEVRASCAEGVAVWGQGRYVSTRSNDTIQTMSPRGVRCIGGAFYTRAEWNAMS